MHQSTKAYASLMNVHDMASEQHFVLRDKYNSKFSIDRACRYYFTTGSDPAALQLSLFSGKGFQSQKQVQGPPFRVAPSFSERREGLWQTRNSRILRLLSLRRNISSPNCPATQRVGQMNKCFFGQSFCRTLHRTYCPRAKDVFEGLHLTYISQFKWEISTRPALSVANRYQRSGLGPAVLVCSRKHRLKCFILAFLQKDTQVSTQVNRCTKGCTEPRKKFGWQ